VLTLEDRVANLTPAAKWSIKNYIASDNGEQIAQSITDGSAVAVCDGSYKDGKGSAAWVIEGATSEGRIRGTNFPPGPSTGQNSYRSELAGIYGILTMLNVICSTHNIQSGAITIACDNLSVIQNSLDNYKPPRLTKAEFDLLYAIKKKLSDLPISYHLQHVKGHQDRYTSVDKLDRLSILNIEMDSLAKSVLHQWAAHTTLQPIEGEPWPIIHKNLKVVKGIDSSLYTIVHGTQIVEYWTKKNKFPSLQIESINWEALSTALTEVGLSRRIFVTKHVTGMCGVGKFMKRWGNVIPMRAQDVG
jgi:hypothetical protein